MDYDRLLGDGSQARKDVEELNALYEEWNACKTQENVLTSARAALMPWVDYDLPLEYGGSESVRCCAVSSRGGGCTGAQEQGDRSF